MKPRSNDCRKLLSAQFGRIPENAVIDQARAGDTHAMEYLLYRYRTLVSTKARYYYLIGAETSDLVQIGMIGLWRAVIDYTPEKNISFLSFARICIERHMISSIKKATRRKQAPLNMALSLDHPDRINEQDTTIAESVSCPPDLQPLEILLRREEQELMHATLQSALSDFEWKVLSNYGLGLSYAEIADDLGCKPKSVDNALERIRSKTTRKCLSGALNAQISGSPALR